MNTYTLWYWIYSCSHENTRQKFQVKSKILYCQLPLVLTTHNTALIHVATDYVYGHGGWTNHCLLGPQIINDRVMVQFIMSQIIWLMNLIESRVHSAIYTVRLLTHGRNDNLSLTYTYQTVFTIMAVHLDWGHNIHTTSKPPLWYNRYLPLNTGKRMGA